jgi:diadenosine tetraphosphate (Ap4A) HIT family hydrolase
MCNSGEKGSARDGVLRMSTCIMDIAPLNEGHMLILPKQHYHDLDELDETTANEIMSRMVSHGSNQPTSQM